jgi:hypothetical protein
MSTTQLGILSAMKTNTQRKNPRANLTIPSVVLGCLVFWALFFWLLHPFLEIFFVFDT